MLQVILKDNKIPLKFLPKINEITHTIVQRIPPNAMITNNMNVSENLRYKCFHGEETNISLESKILVKKYFISKRIKENY